MFRPLLLAGLAAAALSPSMASAQDLCRRLWMGAVEQDRPGRRADAQTQDARIAVQRIREVDEQGTLLAFNGTVNGNRIAGTMTPQGGAVQQFNATKGAQ